MKQKQVMMVNGLYWMINCKWVQNINLLNNIMMQQVNYMKQHYHLQQQMKNLH